MFAKFRCHLARILGYGLVRKVHMLSPQGCKCRHPDPCQAENRALPRSSRGVEAGRWAFRGSTGFGFIAKGGFEVIRI